MIPPTLGLIQRRGVLFIMIAVMGLGVGGLRASVGLVKLVVSVPTVKEWG